jgi:hypothetical protein
MAASSRPCSWTTNGFFAQGFDYGIDNLSQSGSNAFYGGAVQSLGFLNQTFATQAGQRYDVDFWLASDGFLPNRFQVLATVSSCSTSRTS